MSASVMRVGIVAPMHSEARCVTRGAVPSARITEIERTVLLCVSGIGSDRAAIAARELLEHGARALVCIGISGGLDPSLAPGDLVIADRVIGPDGSEHATHAVWRETLARCLAPKHSCRIGPLCESARVLARPDEKRARYESTRALSVDMESAAVAREAARADVPCLVLRAVCDPADMCIPKLALVASDSSGRPRLVRIALGLLRRPSDARELWRLNSAFSRARDALTSAIEIAGPALCAADR